MGPFIIILIFIVFILIIVASSIRIVPQSEAYVIERLGTYYATWESGIHFKVPILDRIAKVVSLKEQVMDFNPQPVITRDNVTMQIDTVVFFQITDSKLYTYGVLNPLAAIENLTATTLRNIIGELELDETLTSRDLINARMRSILDEATDPWGIKINRVEVKNIIPPRDIQDSMEKQMRAERERRAAILTAEGQRESAIKIAEGQKQSQILRAEAEKQSQILAAEGEKEAKVRRAEGEAEAILKIQTATAEGLKALNLAHPTKQVLTLKSFEAFMKVADGKATKIIIPSELQNLGGLVTSMAELAKSSDVEKVEEVIETPEVME
jgi:regulator of protease activity HflC (stomatin/prohibitin superfamily)